MHRFDKICGVLAFALFSLSLVGAGPARAQEAPEHAVTGAELRGAAAAAAQDEAHERARLKRMLSTEAVRDVGEAAGLDVERVRDAVEMLEGRALARASSVAADVEEQLAGGQSTITISTTTIIIVLLVLILIAVA